MKESILYKLLRPIAKLYVKVLIRPTYYGLENIPKEGASLLVGTHLNTTDSLLLMSTTRRPIHFLAKKELWEFPKVLIMGHMGLIKVDRNNKSPQSLIEARKYLEDDKVVLIFPEGTLEKDDKKILPMKIGAFKLAYDTNTPIIPFAIKGTYYKKGLSIKFGKPYYVSSDLDKERDKFIEVIKDLRK
jgi:1-acyl-sn-glycerol-3-phosphate acyltransferase